MTDEEAEAKNDTIAELIAREWGEETPFVLIVVEKDDTGGSDVRCSTNIDTDDLVRLLVKTAEQAGMNDA